MDSTAFNQTNTQGSGAIVYHARSIPSSEASVSIVYSAHIYIQGDVCEPRELSIVQADDSAIFINSLVDSICEHSSQLSWTYPIHILFEICSNLIHAQFNEVSILLLNDGYTLVVSDQGPGIGSPEHAIKAGFTSANTYMKHIIRGVGAGLPIIKNYMESQGGMLTIEPNINGGTVVTLNISGTHDAIRQAPTTQPLGSNESENVPVIYPINERQRSVLAAVMHFVEIGPQLIGSTLGFGVATAHRDLKVLEAHGLIEKLPNKKSKLTQKGSDYIEYLSTH